MDLLDSIMSKMDKPPSINDKQKKMMKGDDTSCCVFGYHIEKRGLVLFFKIFQSNPSRCEFVSL